MCAFVVFMIAARSPGGRVRGPTGRVKSHAASEGTSAAPLWRKPEILTQISDHSSRNKQNLSNLVSIIRIKHVVFQKQKLISEDQNLIRSELESDDDGRKQLVNEQGREPDGMINNPFVWLPVQIKY